MKIKKQILRKQNLLRISAQENDTIIHWTVANKFKMKWRSWEPSIGHPKKELERQELPNVLLLMPCLSAQIWKMVSYTIAQKYTYAPTHVYLTKKAESIWIWCYQNRILSVHSRHSTRLYHKYTPQALYFFLFIICYFRFKFQTEITNLKNCFVRIVQKFV